MNSNVALAAPLRGNIGCVDAAAFALRPADDGIADYNIYGPLEAGFTTSVPGMDCLTSDIPGGIDTRTAEYMMQFQCEDDSKLVRTFHQNTDMLFLALHIDLICPKVQQLSSSHALLVSARLS